MSLVFKKMLSQLAQGLLQQYASKVILDFCSNTLNKDIGSDQECLVNLVYFNIRQDFYINESIRKQILNAATVEDIKQLCDRAFSVMQVKIELTDQQKYDWLIELLSKNCTNISFIDYVLAFTKDYIDDDEEIFSVINNIKPEYAMYGYQLDLANRISEHFSLERKCLLHLPTGAGKTRTAINYICEHLRYHEKGLVIWLADRNELCEQALEEFNKAWLSVGNRELSSYALFGLENNLGLGGIDEGFLVCGLQRLWGERKRNNNILYKKLAENVTLIVFDEAHKAIANTYAEMITFINANSSKQSYLLGLTATPGRALDGHSVKEDNENAALAALFDNHRLTMRVNGYLSPIEYLYDKNYLAKPIFMPIEYADEAVILSVEGKRMRLDVVDALAENDQRNEAILECVKKEVQLGSYIIIFAASVEHARCLAGLFSIIGISSAAVDAGTTNRSAIIRAYKNKEIKVLVNYDVLTAGFDAPHTNVAIIARPTNSLVAYSQMVGRAMRGGEKGNKVCRIYTVNDNIPEFTSVALAFKHWDSYWIED